MTDTSPEVLDEPAYQEAAQAFITYCQENHYPFPWSGHAAKALRKAIAAYITSNAQEEA